MLACLLDNEGGKCSGSKRRTHSENPAENDKHRQRCTLISGHKLEKTEVGAEAEGVERVQKIAGWISSKYGARRNRVVVPVETLGSRFGARSPQKIWKSKNDTIRMVYASLTLVQEAQGIAFARSISEIESHIVS